MIHKSKLMAGVLSLLMVLGIFLSPFAGAAETATINASGSLDINIPRNGNDEKSDVDRQMVYFKISDQELSSTELQEASIKYDAMSIEQIEKELNQKGTLTEKSKKDPADNPGHDVINIRGVEPGAYIIKETKESADSHEYKVIAIAWNSVTGVTSKANAKTKKSDKPLILTKIAYEGENNRITLAGVEFELHRAGVDAPINLIDKGNGNYEYGEGANVTKLVTNANGQITITGLPQAEYFFRETKALEGYVLNDRNRDSARFAFNPSEGHSLNVVNTRPDDRLVSLHKVDGDTNAALTGVEFMLYIKEGETYTPVGRDQDGNYVPMANSDLKFTSDSEGKIVVRNLPALAEAQSYVFREVKAAEGYVANDAFHRVRINGDVTVKNYKNPTPFDLTLTKTDSLTNNPIDRVGFELYRVRPASTEEGNTLTTITERVALTGENGNYEYRDNIAGSDQVFQLYTDTNGQIKVNGLPDGEYFFRENQPKEGYAIKENQGMESNRLDRANNTAALTNRPVTPPTVNPPTPREPFGGHKFVKVDDSAEQKRLADALFALYTVNEDGETVPYLVDGKRMTVRSADNGEFEVTNLPYGKYVLRETAAPAGHVLNVNPIEFTISQTSYQDEAIMIVNERTPGRPTVPPVVSPPGTTPPTRTTVPPTVNPPSTTPPIRQSVPPVVSPPTTYYVPSDKPGVPRGPLVKTGDIRIVILVVVGILMIIGGSVLVKKGEKDQGLLLA